MRPSTLARHPPATQAGKFQRPKLCGPAAQDKVQMHLERMYLLLQRLKRNRNFSRPAFAGLKAGTRPYVEVWAPAMCT